MRRFVQWRRWVVVPWPASPEVGCPCLPLALAAHSAAHGSVKLHVSLPARLWPRLIARANPMCITPLRNVPGDARYESISVWTVCSSPVALGPCSLLLAPRVHISTMIVLLRRCSAGLLVDLEAIRDEKASARLRRRRCARGGGPRICICTLAARVAERCGFPEWRWPLWHSS